MVLRIDLSDATYDIWNDVGFTDFGFVRQLEYRNYVRNILSFDLNDSHLTPYYS